MEEFHYRSSHGELVLFSTLITRHSTWCYAFLTIGSGMSFGRYWFKSEVILSSRADSYALETWVVIGPHLGLHLE